MLDKQIEEFKKYTNNFDLNNEAISMKYYHTFRVVDYAKKIVESLTSDLRLIELSVIAALLHDIARFEQYTIYKTYKDRLSFNHGKRGAEILSNDNYIYNYVDNEDDANIVINAVKKHNDLNLELTFDDFTDTVARVVRDADKLDILITQCNELINQNYNLNKALVSDILNHRSCDYKNMTSIDDHILGILGFVFDLNFKKSFEIINTSNVIDTKINVLRNCSNDDSTIDLIEKEIKQYIDKKIGDEKYVRQKIQS